VKPQFNPNRWLFIAIPVCDQSARILALEIFRNFAAIFLNLDQPSPMAQAGFRVSKL
jgi:hypothetical protein